MRVQIRHSGVVRGLDIAEAQVLVELLRLERVSAARSIAPRLVDAMDTGDEVVLDGDEWIALCAMLQGTEGEMTAGLQLLKNTCTGSA